MDILCNNGTLNDTYDAISGMTSLPPCTTASPGGVKPVGGGPGGGRPGGYGRFGRMACGYCTDSCIYKSVEITFLIGIIANLIVIFRVIFDKRLRDPTFTAIAALAIADLVFLSINVIASIESVMMTINCWFPYVIYASRPYYIILAVSWFAGSGHVALLAILRYVTLAHPIKANVILTCKRVMMMSGLVWILGLIFMGALTGLIIGRVIEAGRGQIFQIYLWFFVYLMPFVITATLHFAKVRMVKKATKNTATEATRKSVERMAKIVLVVIICAGVLPFPRLMYKILNLHGVDLLPSEEFKLHFKGIAQLFYLINNFINPFLYGFMSIKFRESLKDMVSCGKDHSEDSTATSDTPLSARKLIHLQPVDPNLRAGSIASLTSV